MEKDAHKGKRKPWTLREFGGKTLWDWLQLLIVPVVLSLITVVFAWQQDFRQDQIETKRAKAERELAEQRADDEALQAYLSQMSSLLLERDLRASEKGTEVRTLARARILTVLSRLDPSGKTAIMQFLVEAKLVQRVDRRRAPIIGLSGADLSGANLDGAKLHDADLAGADLSNAHLREADLSEADLYRANLGGANLSNAYLRRTDLREADLREADLSGAFLRDANLSSWLRGADLREADLSNADLREADLSGAHLREAVLRDADLIRADLSGAFLRDANLSNAVRWTEKQLTAAAGLAGTTMPNGQKYKDWLKDPGPGWLYTTKFEPALSYNISGGWKLTTETTDELFLEGLERGQLIFDSPNRVFDPSSPSEPTKVSAPENVDEWASWFQRHPNLDTSEPVSVSVDGADGMQIDVTLSSTPENYPRELCGEHCVALYPPGISSTKGFKDRFIIVEVEGKPVVIDVAAQADKFEDFLPKAQKMLDTVEWKSE